MQEARTLKGVKFTQAFFSGYIPPLQNFAPTAASVEISADGTTWTNPCHSSNLTLGPVNGETKLIDFAQEQTARYIRTADNGTIQPSDENQKNSIEPLPDKYVTMLDQIMPKRYKINNGTSGRYHAGFIAQDVEKAMALAGVDPLEFGGWIKDTDQDGNPIYMLRYTEFIAILWAKIRDLEGKINA